MDWMTAIPIIFIVLIIITSSIKIVKEYERGVIFRLGRLLGAKGPGIFFVIPVIDKMQVIDLRIRAIDIPKQMVITRDNVTVDVDAVLYFRVLDPTLAVIKVERYVIATSLLAQTALRDVLGAVELDTLLTERESLNKKLQEMLDRSTDPWGIKVTAVTIQGVELPDTMLRSIARQAEAEREKRSRIIVADGELKASKAMSDAAKLYEENPMAMRLRELQTLSDVSKEKNLIVVTQALGDTGNTVALATGISERMKR